MKLRIKAAASATMTHAQGDGVRVAKVGKPTQFVLHPADVYGNLLRSGEGLPFTCVMQCGDDEVSGNIVSNLDGTYTVSYELAAAGQYLMHIKLGDTEIASSPFTIIAQAGKTTSYFLSLTLGEPNAKRCTKSFDGVLTAVAGETTTFTVQARDQFGNVCAWGGHPFTITASAGADVKIVDNDDGTGIYTCYYTGTVAGKHIISVSLDDLPVGGAPFPVHVIPGEVCAGTCTASGDGLVSAVSGIPAMFSIQTRDRCENKRTEGGNAEFTVQVHVLVIKSLFTHVGCGSRNRQWGSCE